MARNYPVISADSHITEAPNTYIDFIDPNETHPRDIDPCYNPSHSTEYTDGSAGPKGKPESVL